LCCTAVEVVAQPTPADALRTQEDEEEDEEEEEEEEGA